MENEANTLPTSHHAAPPFFLGPQKIVLVQERKMQLLKTNHTWSKSHSP